MKNKIIIYSAMLLVGMLIGAGGFYLIAGSPTVETHNHIDEEGQLYSCGMHPNIIENEAGTCPICGMNLTPIKNNNKSGKSSEKGEIIYWRAPMNPNEVYDAPGKSQMGMDLVPVYEDEGSASGVVTVDGSVLQSMNVKMEFVKSRDLSSTIYTNGTLVTDERKEFALTTKIDGWIEKLYINYTGQKVKKGQKLVDIYSPELLAAQQELLTAINYQSSVNNSIKSEMTNNAKRKLELFDISKTDIDKIILTKKINKYMTLYAPFSGTVLSKNVLVGEMVKAGKEIIKISDLTTLWLKADIYESELSKISVGSETKVSFSYNAGKEFVGKVTFIYPTVNPTTRTVTVRINIKNDNDELKPSMFGNVIIKGKSFGEIPTVPETAVLRSGKQNIAILSLGEGKFKPVEITLGQYSEGYYQVLAGLKVNDAIVTSGQFMIDSESSLRAAVKLFTSVSSEETKENEVSDEKMKDMNSVKKADTSPKPEMKEHQHDENESIVRSGTIDVKAIDVNGNGKVYECPMDWNVIGDEDGRCPVCNMFLNEYTIEKTNKNLMEHGFEHK